MAVRFRFALFVCVLMSAACSESTSPVDDGGGGQDASPDTGADDGGGDPDAHVEPDGSTGPDASVEPDASTDPDAAIEPDASTDPDGGEEPDAGAEPDAGTEPDAGEADAGGGVDECAMGIDDCHADATCTDTAGGFTCACNGGFFGTGVVCAPWTVCQPGQRVLTQGTQTMNRTCTPCAFGAYSTTQNATSCAAWTVPVCLGAGVFPGGASSTTDRTCKMLADGVDLSQGVLENARLDQLADTTYENVTLFQADLDGANLTLVRITHSSFVAATFIGANLSLATLSESNLTGAQLPGVPMNRIGLGGSNLTGANLMGANLLLASAPGAIMIGASFANANLTGVILRDAMLMNANLNGAILDGVVFTRANLTGATFVGTALPASIGWDNTTCPDGTNSNANGDTCAGHL